MIATSLANRLVPTFILASQRRRGKPLLKKQPFFAAPLPKDYSALPPLPLESPDIKNIRFVTALSFAKFFQNPDYKVVGADGPNRRTVKRMCVSECIVVVIQSVFYLRIG
jgi:hypothetical protein